MGHRGRDEDQQMFVPSNRTWVASSSPKKSADQEGGREKPNDWLGPQNGSGGQSGPKLVPHIICQFLYS